MKDVIIIGAGVSGASIARSLSKYVLDILVLEKELDIGMGASKANSGIVHTGFHAEPGSLMASLNVKGAAMMEETCKDLDVPFSRNGHLVLCYKEEEMQGLEDLIEQGQKNGVEDLSIINQQDLRELEPEVNANAYGALYTPRGGIVCPMTLTLAYAELAASNGVQFRLGEQVTDIQKTSDGYRIKTNKETYEARAIVNAAGVYADDIHNMVSENKIEIIPRKGEYIVLDKSVKNLVHHTLFQLPNEWGKGVLISPTTHGSIIIGPNANDFEDKDDLLTSTEGLEDIYTKAKRLVDEIPIHKAITSFAGLRAHEKRHDFRIEEVSDAPFFFDCASIESPGLTSSPAIGQMVEEMVISRLGVSLKEQYHKTRKGITNVKGLSQEEKESLIHSDKNYGEIICRCMQVSKGEMLEAIHRPLGATTLDGIKRRTKAGMGMCQRTHCGPITVELLHKETGLKKEDLVSTKNQKIIKEMIKTIEK